MGCGADGQLLEMPYHYRDGRTDGMEEDAFKIMGRRRIYDLTGIQFMQLNTIYQLFSMKLNGDEVLAKTKHLVMMADLVSYFLCGEIFCEYSLASTSQLLNMKTGEWESEIFDKLGLPVEIMLVCSGRYDCWQADSGNCRGAGFVNRYRLSQRVRMIRLTRWRRFQPMGQQTGLICPAVRGALSGWRQPRRRLTILPMIFNLPMRVGFAVRFAC